MKLAMIQDEFGCRLSLKFDSGESVIQTFGGRVEMKRFSKKYAREHGMELHNLKKTGVLVPVET